jgi:hypothetical protein
VPPEAGEYGGVGFFEHQTGLSSHTLQQTSHGMGLDQVCERVGVLRVGVWV